MKLRLSVMGCTAAIFLSGCATYNYQLTEPASLARIIADQPAAVNYEPLTYNFERHGGRLAATIGNLTEDTIMLLGDRSHVVDPKGETHPIRGRVLAARSFTKMLLPPVPASYMVGAPYGWWGPGYFAGPTYPAPFFGSFYGGYYGPVITSYEIATPYDWDWHSGPVRLQLTYEREGKTFEHTLVFIRERDK